MLKCKICGTEFPAIKERHYIARENNRTGAVVVFSKTKKRYTMLMIARCADHKLSYRNEKEILNRTTTGKRREREKMLNFNLDSVQAAEKLVKLCERYCDIADIDVNCGRHSIDGRSLMGVISLIGNFVTVNPQTDDQDIIRKFGIDLEGIK